MLKKTLAGLALGLSLTGVLAQDINFGIISTESTQNLKANWQPLLDDMAKQTGLRITPFFAPDYAGVIEAMRFNKVHVAWYGNKAAIHAVDRAGGEVFAQKVNADGTKGYYSHLIVHRDSPLRSLDDVLKNGSNLRFGAGDPNSTSGFVVPNFYAFAKNNVDPRTHFKSARSANHETNALAVAKRHVDVATNNSESLDRLAKRFPEMANNIRVIWSSPLIPLDPLVMRTDLPEATKAKIRNFFFNYGKTDAREREVLMKALQATGIQPSSNAQLLPIRQLTLFGERTRVESDTALSAAARKTRMAEIDRQLAALAAQKAAL